MGGAPHGETANALLAHLRKCRMGAAEDATSEAVSTLFWLLANNETGLLDQKRLLRVVSRSTPPGDVDAEETALALTEEQKKKRKRKKPDLMERILGLNPNYAHE